jgi:hypothetical protein
MPITSVTLEVNDETWLSLKINDIIFFCEYEKSANKDYILAWYDGDPVNGIGGHRTSGKGYYFLIKNNELIFIGQIERPHHGKVANNGNFILNDWLLTSDTKSKAYAFTENGELLIKKSLRASLVTNGISPTGKFAVYKTCNSNTPDHSVLLMFDLNARAMIWKKKFTFQDPSHFSLEGNKYIKLHYPDRTLILDWKLNHVGYETPSNSD